MTQLTTEDKKWSNLYLQTFTQTQDLPYNPSASEPFHLYLIFHSRNNTSGGKSK